ncbi:MAG: hypothetical protein KY467_14660 [Gemmatimonadetes bacterium]|nr:hypothetical protein [Gemmatimonadota bacterium]
MPTAVREFRDEDYGAVVGVWRAAGLTIMTVTVANGVRTIWRLRPWRVPPILAQAEV